MGGLQAMMSNLSTEKTPCPAISWYLEGAQLKMYVEDSILRNFKKLTNIFQ